MADARRLLRDAELEDFRMSLDEFRDKALAGDFDKELEEVYLRSRISRLQALQTQVELRMMELFSSQRDVLRRWERPQAAQLTRYLEELQLGDASNREGHAAKVYFNALFGKEFSRALPIPENAALNYGYGLILSALSR